MSELMLYEYVRVLLAPARFAGTLTAREAAAAMARGWSQAAPHDELLLVPMSDGGPGFLDVLSGSPALADGQVLAATVADPLGRPVPAGVLVADREGRRTAYLEASQACGADLLAGSERDPTTTSSFGLGQLLELALSTEPATVVVGLGATATHDAGAGLLAALGVGDRARLARGGLALADTVGSDLAGLESAVERFRRIELVLASAADLPLLGLQGASAVQAQDRGATAEQAQHLEAALGHWAALVRLAHPERKDLITGSARRLDREAGSGAGGGLGYALLLLGARRVDGAAFVARTVRLADVLRSADLVVTGEGSYDWTSLRAGVPAAVAELALAAGVPAVVLAGRVEVGRREAMAAGLSGRYAVCDRPDQVPVALADPSGTLAARAARVAGTWSPSRGSST